MNGEYLVFSVAAQALRIGAYGFINKVQFYAGFTDRLKLKDGVVTAIMIPVMSRNRSSNKAGTVGAQEVDEELAKNCKHLGMLAGETRVESMVEGAKKEQMVEGSLEERMVDDSPERHRRQPGGR
ncbi:hypothetical protein DPX16_12648 [Anabarilius grahami]|uniref:Uncharacterized protein n=1 Tax=Anabarilius grahami TaxID=495550 RepID=A0A3N0YKG6_ANAGA|nr:hypothetical protein DPX16_12648 [Anabarilius grahami]